MLSAPAWNGLPLAAEGMELGSVIVDTRRYHVIRNSVLEVIEPECRHLIQDFPFVRNGRGQHDIECRKAVRHYNQIPISEIVDVADFAAAVQLDPRKIV